MSSDVPSVAVVITSHNRKAKTVRCIAAAQESAAKCGINLNVVLVDDGSSDGTPSEVVENFPRAVVLNGGGELFWTRGMALGQAYAIAMWSPDYILWLNDDTNLSVDAIYRLLSWAEDLHLQAGTPIVVVGATVCPASKLLTYSGGVKTSLIRRFRYRRVWSDEKANPCDVMNGNIVLIPRDVYQAVGNLDSTFEHAMGDTDYALRVWAAGYRVYVAPGVMGECPANPPPAVHARSNHSARTKWRSFTAKKGLPVRSWRHFCRKHGGIFWWIYFTQPYLKFWVLVCMGMLTRRRLVSG